MIFTPEEIHDAWWNSQYSARIENSMIKSYNQKDEGIKKLYIDASNISDIEEIVQSFYPALASPYLDDEKESFRVNLIKIQQEKYNNTFIEYLK